MRKARPWPELENAGEEQVGDKCVSSADAEFGACSEPMGDGCDGAASFGKPHGVTAVRGDWLVRTI